MSKYVAFEAPSNIAFVKYWGKYGRQYPLNPSISMTLNKCTTKCEIEYEIIKDHGIIQSFLFEESENDKFKHRIQKFLDSIHDVYPLAKDLVLKIKTSNSFPHSAGIASSASAMAALCSCLAEIERSDNIKKRSSYLARLASGSACRSIFPKYAIWGESEFVDSSNEYAISFDNIHENFTNLNDSVLIVSSEEKAVSSSQGHALMNAHFYREGRLNQAVDNFRVMLNALKSGNYEDFGQILENEALSLHALMMSSYPAFTLLKPESLKLIELIQAFRKSNNLPCYFTIDAGPNIHLIYPKFIEAEVHNFLDQECSPYIQNIIHDEIGNGPLKL